MQRTKRRKQQLNFSQPSEKFRENAMVHFQSAFGIVHLKSAFGNDDDNDIEKLESICISSLGELSTFHQNPVPISVITTREIPVSFPIIAVTKFEQLPEDYKERSARKSQTNICGAITQGGKPCQRSKSCPIHRK